MPRFFYAKLFCMILLTGVTIACMVKSYGSPDQQKWMALAFASAVALVAFSHFSTKGRA